MSFANALQLLRKGLTRASARGREGWHGSCSRDPQEDAMYYGIGGTILLILLVLFLLGRI
jgi:hypothetical protein